jgi:hypothetical protein
VARGADDRRAERLHPRCQRQPIGAVRTYADGNSPPNGSGNGAIWGMVMHHELPLLYMVGPGMGGVVVQELDSEGEPTGPQTYYSFGGVGKYSIGIFAGKQDPILPTYYLIYGYFP